MCLVLVGPPWPGPKTRVVGRRTDHTKRLLLDLQRSCRCARTEAYGKTCHSDCTDAPPPPTPHPFLVVQSFARLCRPAFLGPAPFRFELLLCCRHRYDRPLLLSVGWNNPSSAHFLIFLLFITNKIFLLFFFFFFHYCGTSALTFRKKTNTTVQEGLQHSSCKMLRLLSDISKLNVSSSRQHLLRCNVHLSSK